MSTTTASFGIDSSIPNRLRGRCVCALTAFAQLGVSSGKETSHICYDIDLSTRAAHAYPVSMSEAEQIMGNGPICAIDDLNC
jgi:hypothetical protein